MSATALLLLDLQPSITERFGDQAVLDRAAAAAGTARDAGVPVIFVRLAFREGMPEISPENASFTMLKRSGVAATEGDPAVGIHPALGRRADEPVVTKRRVSAFAGSDLEVLLRGLGVRRLVLGGISTSGVVLSTVRQAADLDFGLTVLEDACADRDPEVHRVLTEKVFPRQAEVIPTASWRPHRS